MKRIVKYSGIIIFFSIIIFILIYIIKYKTKNSISYINPINQYKILIKTIGEPYPFFGPTSVKITLLNENNKKIKSITRRIYNDGAPVKEENVKVKWFNQYVEVTLISQEQEDDIQNIYY